MSIIMLNLIVMITVINNNEGEAMVRFNKKETILSLDKKLD